MLTQALRFGRWLRVRAARSLKLFAVMFMATLAVGFIVMEPAPVATLVGANWSLGVALFACAALVAPFRWRRAAWHWLANATVFAPTKIVQRPWVIDGDTIDDRVTGIRYRVANIDAPETGEEAKCIHERQRGELARAALIQVFKAAKTISVRPTWRRDIHGRTVAFVLADGADIGEILVARGLALPWRGRREKWCGARGGLARMARAAGDSFACRYCAHWR